MPVHELLEPLTQNGSGDAGSVGDAEYRLKGSLKLVCLAVLLFALLAMLWSLLVKSAVSVTPV